MYDVKLIEKQAKEIRRLIVKMIGRAQSGHPGGSLSCADLVSALYFGVMNVDPKDPAKPDRDRFVMSKGHACPALYAALALKGYFPMEELDTLRDLGSILQGHPSALKTPGVDVSTGSLGQGLSVANGIALGAKLDGDDYYVYCLMGDGEIEEGQIWEAAMKFEAFGWNVITVDGHDVSQILAAIEIAKRSKGLPSLIILNTIKGKGVSFMENQAGWHGKAPSAEQVEQALKELED